MSFRIRIYSERKIINYKYGGLRMNKTTEINWLKRAALEGKKSRESLIDRKVRYIGNYDPTSQLKHGDIATIKKISAGNYDAVIYLHELPKKRLHISGREIVPNTYDIEDFELVD